MKTIVFANFKGGVGKTTTAQNIGAYLAKKGYNVCLMDLDPQANLTMGCNQLETKALSVFDIFSGAGADIIPIKKGLNLIRGDIRLATADMQFGGQMKREHIIDKFIKHIKKQFDILIVDCPPYLGLLTQNALTIADYLFTPIDCEYYSIYGFEYFKYFLSENGFNIDGIIASKFDSRQILHKDFLSNLRGTEPELMFKTVIPKNVSLAEAQAYGKDIFDYSPKSNGAKAFNKLGREIVKLIE